MAAGRRKIALSVAPLLEKTFVLEELEGCKTLAAELEHAGKEAGAEYALTVSFVLREELLWQSRGMRSHSDRRFCGKITCKRWDNRRCRGRI